MAQLTPHFSTNRTVREYTEQHYLPAAAAYRMRMADRGAIGGRIVERQSSLERSWPAVRFRDVRVETRGEQYLFEVEIVLGDIDPETVRVDLYADGPMGQAAVRQEMKRVRPVAGSSGNHVYGASVPSSRSASDYTPRVVPHHDGIAVPLEDARIQWQR